MQVLDQVAALPLGPNAAAALKKIPGCGVPVCVLQSTFANTFATSPINIKVGRNKATSESFTFDSPAVLYGRLAYNKFPSGLRSATVVVSADDERGYDLDGKRFRHTCYDCDKKMIHLEAVELMQVSLANFLRLAARRAGLNSDAQDKILSFSRPRTVIFLCNSLESIHDFELQNATPIDLRKHFQMSVATAASYLPLIPASCHTINVSSNAQREKLADQIPGKESSMIQTVFGDDVESNKVILAFNFFMWRVET
jgi:hypothetical protein